MLLNNFERVSLELIYIPLTLHLLVLNSYRSSHSEVFLGKGALKICSKFTGEHPCRSAISIKLLCNFIEIARRHGCSPINLLHNFRTPLSKTTHLWTATSVFMNSKNLLCLRSSLCRVLIVPKRPWSLPDLLIVRKCIIN